MAEVIEPRLERAPQRATDARNDFDVGGATSLNFVMTMTRPASALIAAQKARGKETADVHREGQPTRKHLDVACPTCAAQVGERCVTVRRLPWIERWAAPTHPAHTARQLLSADPPARISALVQSRRPVQPDPDLSPRWGA